MAVLYLSPGPDPLRRLITAAKKAKVDQAIIASATDAIKGFDSLIRNDIGDRSALDAIVSAWLPEARAEFELRRKQAAYRAMSQLMGSAININLATAILRPSSDGEHLDLVWLFGLMGVQRLRPGSTVRFASRRMAHEDEPPRKQQTLDGESVDGFADLRLDEFCSTPPAELEICPAGEVVHYILSSREYGPRSAVDLTFAELNRKEITHFPPVGSRRKRYFAAEMTAPSKILVFDVLLHEDVMPGQDPSLIIYDTSFEGTANVNDRSRDINRLDLCETIQHLGKGISRFRTSDVPRYLELLQYTCDRLGWEGDKFRGYRCRIEYPIYGSQVTMAFDAVTPPGA